MTDNVTMWKSAEATVKGEVVEVAGREGKYFLEVPVYPGSRFTRSLRIGDEVHRTREEAVAKANQHKAKRIASLEKTLAKLRAMVLA